MARGSSEAKSAFLEPDGVGSGNGDVAPP